MLTKSSLLAVVFILFIGYSAEAGFRTGNILAEGMYEYDKVIAKSKELNYVQASEFMSYVIGVYDASPELVEVVPKKFSAGQLCEIVSKYLKNNHERWNEPASTLVKEAVLNAFTKKNKKAIGK